MQFRQLLSNPWARFASLYLATALTLCGGQQPAASPAGTQIDVDELLSECQRPVRGKSHAGMVWWIPPEFWEASGGTQDPAAKALVDSLRQYTVVAVVVGKVSPLGTISWIPTSDLRSKSALRDQRGNEYRPLENISAEAQLISSVIRPILSNAIGKMGENLELLFFPAKGKNGEAIADPRKKGSFSIVLLEIAGAPENVYQWQLPLSSVLPPKFCPVGKESVKANWNYCPWHGVPLDTSEPRAPNP